MILLLNPYPPLMQWSIMDGKNLLEGKGRLGTEFINSVVEAIGNIRKIKGIGYFLYNGGGEIKSSIHIFDSNTLQNLKKCVHLLPEYNNLTYESVLLWYEKMPWVMHVLFCDTGFFTGAPPEASLYAVPKELSRTGIRRYGGYGIYHQHALECAEQYFGSSIKRTINIYIGNNSNIVAIKNGVPLDFSIGFTMIEGIFSDTGSGDIDPTIIFELHSAGMSFEEINNLLSHLSGFTAFLGKKTTIYDVLKNKNGIDEAEALKNFIYNILKYIGSYISILNGVDSIIFISNHIKESRELINEICRGLNFIGVKTITDEIGESNINVISKADSKTKVICLNINKWEIMNNKFKNMLNNKGVKKNGK